MRFYTPHRDIHLCGELLIKKTKQHPSSYMGCCFLFGGNNMKNKKLMFAVSIICLTLFTTYMLDIAKPKTTKAKALPEVGVLQFVSHPALDDIYQGMLDELANQGFVDGETVNITFQNGQADQSKLTNMTGQLLSKDPDVLVGIATPAAQALANQTQQVPIILGAISDPEAAGLVKSNQAPGGNITGVSDQAPIEEQIKLIRTLVPDIETIGVIYSSAEDNSLSQVEKFKELAEKNKIVVKTYAEPSTNEISQMTHVMTNEVDAIYTPTDNLIASAFQTIVGIADDVNIPIFPSVDTMVEEGGLATIGINQYELGIQTGRMVAGVLNEELTVSETPIYTFDTGDLLINEEQAKKLGIKIPEKLIKESDI